MTKAEALRKLREATADHFNPANNTTAPTEAIRYWIRRCKELGYSDKEIDAVLHSEIIKRAANR